MPNLIFSRGEITKQTLMPPDNFTLETTLDLQRAKETVLQALDSRGYRVEQEFDARVLAKHGLSGTYYPHEVEVRLDDKPGSTIISASISHHSAQTYLKRLSDDLVKLLPPLPAKTFSPVEKPTIQQEPNYEVKILNQGLNAGEQVIWSHTIQKGVFDKETAERWFITNMRAIKQCPATKDNPQEKFTAVGWLDLSDSVVMNTVRKSKGNRVGTFAGAYGGHAFAGTTAGFSAGTSMTFGDIVLLHNDREVLRFQGVSDPNEVNKLIKTLKKEYADTH
jgi:hypothetical protein